MIYARVHEIALEGEERTMPEPVPDDLAVRDLQARVASLERLLAQHLDLPVYEAHRVDLVDRNYDTIG